MLENRLTGREGANPRQELGRVAAVIGQRPRRPGAAGGLVKRLKGAFEKWTDRT